jgi:hypothetical protein
VIVAMRLLPQCCGPRSAEIAWAKTRRKNRKSGQPTQNCVAKLRRADLGLGRYRIR